MSDLAANLQDVRKRIERACDRSGRDPAAVELLAVSKTFPAETIREAVEAGQMVFAESRLQEAEPKIAILPPGLHWHFIGRVQRNKVRRSLPLFEAIHAVDSLRLAGYMDGTAAELGLFPRVCLQVNQAGESTKGGFDPEILKTEIHSLLALPRLEVAGLMSIPPVADDPEASRPWFAALRRLRDELQDRTGTPLPWLSMGMSGDFETAIEEGATHVRVGSAIFGRRAYRVEGELA